MPVSTVATPTAEGSLGKGATGQGAEAMQRPTDLARRDVTPVVSLSRGEAQQPLRGLARPRRARTQLLPLTTR